MSTPDTAVQAGNAVRLAADGSAVPSIDLRTFRMLSDRERMMGPGKERAAVRARIMLYLPALLDHVDELAAAASSPVPPRPPGVLPRG